MTAGRSIVALQCEFTVPAHLDVVEPRSENVLATEAVLDARLEALRRDLDADGRWSTSRVASVRPADAAEGWHILVWTVPLSDAIEHIAQACRGVCDAVTSVMGGASILACRRCVGD